MGKGEGHGTGPVERTPASKRPRAEATEAAAPAKKPKASAGDEAKSADAKPKT